MEARLLRRDALSQLVDELIKNYQVIAPSDEFSYGVITSSADLDLRQHKPNKSLKEHFFPQREELLRFQVGAKGATVSVDDPAGALTSDDAAGASRVVFGAHPCDVAALPVLDELFAWDYLDSSYLQRRRNTTIISVACDEPCEECFCVSLGGSPAGTEGADLLLTPLEHVYHVQIVTDKGQALVEKYEGLFQESNREMDRESVLVEEASRARITKTVDPETLAKTLDFENPAWQTVTSQCVDCGICTFVCPTCHCFDIQDEGDSADGVRVRLWDACAFRSFTKTAVHEPRAAHASRYRQRIMHKFKYYPQNFGKTLCTGCGRCILHCPVGIDVTDVLQKVQG